MSVDEKTVERIAHLARIRLDETERAPLAGELGQILAWVEQLAEVDTGNVPPMTSVADMKLPWRADEVTDGNHRDDILANAPQTEHGFFVVPKVIE